MMDETSPSATMTTTTDQPREVRGAKRRLLRSLPRLIAREPQHEMQAAAVASDALALSEERLRLAEEAAGLGSWELVGPAAVPHLSPAARTMLGLGREAQVDARAFLSCVHPGDRTRIARLLKGLRDASDTTTSADFRIRTAGAVRTLTLTARTIASAGGPRLIAVLQYVTDRNHDARGIVESERRLNLALQAGRVVAWERDLTTGWVTRSNNSLDIFGIASGPYDEYLARVHPDDRALLTHIEGGHALGSTVEFRFYPPDGPMMWLAVRGLPRANGMGRRHFVGVTFDITGRKQAEAELWRAANHDPLTGLPNRALFVGRLDAALGAAERDGTTVSLLRLDLDDFKDVNDVLGHEGGDDLLLRTAATLRAQVRADEHIARIGGDEFAVAFIGRPDAAPGAARADALLQTLRQPHRYGVRTIEARASGGLATFPCDDRHPAELMKDADFALCHAKSDGRNRLTIYTPELRRSRETRLALAQEIRDALGYDQIRPFYQPKIDLRTGAVSGLESLARWCHPVRGVLTPAAFGAVFEDGELGRAISDRMLATIVKDIRRWLDARLVFGRVALNLSTADFTREGLAAWVLSTLELSGISTRHLEVEVTETVLVGRSGDRVLVELDTLHQAGVTIALDDFGTGFASLIHLKQFPVDTLKIDKSFVSGLHASGEDEAIVSAVVGLGRNLRMRVIAEGIETRDQAILLAQHGCDEAQGYLFATPMAADLVPGFLEGWSAATFFEKSGVDPG